MRRILIACGFLLLPAIAYAAKSPCGIVENCDGWQKVAVQHYDTHSNFVTIWEKESGRVICIDPGPETCSAYGGNLEQFKADAVAETVKREAQVKKESAPQEAVEAEYNERMKDHGIELKKNGWKEIVRCEDGHQWSYVLEKSDTQKFCKGINALAGPTEDACVPFTGNMEQFKTVAAKAQKQMDAYNAASKQGRLDDYLSERMKHTESLVNCWDGFSQAKVSTQQGEH